MDPKHNVEEIQGREDEARHYTRNQKLPDIDICDTGEHNGQRIGRNQGIDGAHPHERSEAYALAVPLFQHIRKEDGAEKGAGRNGGAAQSTDDDPHNDGQDRESAADTCLTICQAR